MGPQRTKLTTLPHMLWDDSCLPWRICFPCLRKTGLPLVTGATSLQLTVMLASCAPAVHTMAQTCSREKVQVAAAILSRAASSFGSPDASWDDIWRCRPTLREVACVLSVLSSHKWQLPTENGCPVVDHSSFTCLCSALLPHNLPERL